MKLQNSTTENFSLLREVYGGNDKVTLKH